MGEKTLRAQPPKGMAMALQLNTPTPKFAVVGHPNKGKSSIVASLANDDSVKISDTPGTTTKSRSFPFRVDGTVVYTLFDTPGFQRARQVLAWLHRQDVSAHRRAEAVEAFIRAHQHDPKYNDEVELLTPIVQGAGIIYVVDGSKPYGVEYEAEMEILRWTGQPSMALINRIESSDYTQEWRRALEQYFRSVREYDPMCTDPAQKIALLETMAQLEEAWTPLVKRSIGLFEHSVKQKREESAKTIARLMQNTLSYVVQLQIQNETPSEAQEQKVRTLYQNHLRVLEERSQQTIEKLWQHKRLQKVQEKLLFEEIDLFSKESESIFGLSREEMLVTGITGGAVTGAGIDLLFAGHTLLLGGAIGAVVGGVGAYFGFDKIAEVKLLGRTLGSKYLETGPMENRNFPYILLGRSLYHLSAISRRSHAKRGTAEIAMDTSFKTLWMSEEMRKSLEKIHTKFRTGKALEGEEMQRYEALILTCIDKVVL